MVHAGMQRLMECTRAHMRDLERQNLFADTLDGNVKPSDMGGFADAQSMAPVSPAMHEEFVIRYQAPLLEMFRENSYGCCEPLHHKLPMLKRRVPRLCSVSISPFADRRISAQELGGTNIIYSWKPSPFHIAAVTFDGEEVRRYIRETVDLCREHNCVLEMTLKDTHTCNQQPWRFGEWVRIAREEVERERS